MEYSCDLFCNPPARSAGGSRTYAVLPPTACTGLGRLPGGARPPAPHMTCGGCAHAAPRPPETVRDSPAAEETLRLWPLVCRYRPAPWARPWALPTAPDAPCALCGPEGEPAFEPRKERKRARRKTRAAR